MELVLKHTTIILNYINSQKNLNIFLALEIPQQDLFLGFIQEKERVGQNIIMNGHHTRELHFKILNMQTILQKIYFPMIKKGFLPFQQ